MESPLVSLSGATVRFGEITAFEDITLEINAGELVAVVGRPGAGKSTLIHAVAGLVPLAAGTLEVRTDVFAYVSCTVGADRPARSPAVATALNSDRPLLIIADDPTPFMDPDSAAAARTDLRVLAALGHAVLGATLDEQLADSADRTVALTAPPAPWQ